MAEKSTNFFQGIKYVPNLEELDQEKQPMKVDEKRANEKNANDEPLSFSDFCEFLPNGHIKKNCKTRYHCCPTVKPAAKKAMIIGLTMSVCNQLSGAWPLMTYTQAIFEEAGSTLSPNLSAIIVSLVQMAANVLSIVVVDRIDRKKLYSISAIATATGLAALGLHSLYKEHLTEYASIPIVAFSFTIFVASCGILPLHYVILVEVMPKKVRQNRSLRKWLPSSSNCYSSFLKFSDTKCRQFDLYDGVLGDGRICATNIPNGIRSDGNAQLHVFLCDILLFSLPIHNCRHTRDKRQIIWNNNASIGTTKMM